ncbi:ABC transporter ATP-binding protein [Starkeya sp. ORNL1]|uniref:ABC transporter ATP-binding protein n=1 Tax=Starkeya sp. ORNL1 TaxID=2709380 RepID=UPI001463AB9E|nr:ABC transporter ATP-binding protein [Starkeya sp. ORNL1]QJP14184.1 ABC transporter ATP-binding protein [Starkeya sp. ORNL1]
MTTDAFLAVDGLSVGYGGTKVLAGVDLAIAKGEFVALLGASGCGKTTLLRTIAGFVSPSAGAVRVDGRDVTRLAPDRRGMALVFQSYALWPHMSVAQNIGYGLRLRGRSRAEINARVGEIEALLGLTGLGGRKPPQLSGGQRQRVALGRALAIDPEILLLDEPLSNLDARIRLTVRHEIRALQQRLGITAIHVTHDREEAMVMADRIVILNEGRIAQAGTPLEVYNHPASSFVAAFMGAENVLPLNGHALAAGAVEARFRAEAAQLLDAVAVAPAPHGVAEFAGTVEQLSYPGGLWRHGVRIGETLVLVDAPAAFGPGTAVKVRVPEHALFRFPAPNAPPDSTSSRAAAPVEARPQAPRPMEIAR